MLVLWLGLKTFTAGSQVQSLVRELKSCMPQDMGKNIHIPWLNYRGFSVEPGHLYE